MTTRQAVFLVGGKGTRLGALTQSTPKPLLEIAPGLRFLDVVLGEAARHGFTDILLLAGHFGDQVEAAYHDRQIREARVTVVREPEPQGTGGALRFAAGMLAPQFLMGNGDSLFEMNLRALTTPFSRGSSARLALREVPDPGRYGAVALEGSKVVRFLEKDPSLPGPALINAGLYAMDRSVLDLIEGPCSIEKDIFPKLAMRSSLEGAAYQGYFLDIGLPDTYAQAKREVPPRLHRPCAFLDRDGVINHDDGYTHKPEDLRFIEGAPAAIRRLNEAGFYVIVVTNQAGIARGHFSEEDTHRFHQAMSDELAEGGAHIDAFYHCPYHEDGPVARYRIPNHPDRKPNPGMIQRAMREWPIDANWSFLIGDRESDIQAARAAGIRGFLFTGGSLDCVVQSSLDKVRTGSI